MELSGHRIGRYHKVHLDAAKVVSGVLPAQREGEPHQEQQQDLFADRLSSAGFAANQLRLWLSAFACMLVERLRAFALKGTELAQASAGTIRLKLFKLAARVETSTRRIRVRLSEVCPKCALFAHVWTRLRFLPG